YISAADLPQNCWRCIHVAWPCRGGHSSSSDLARPVSQGGRRVRQGLAQARGQRGSGLVVARHDNTDSSAMNRLIASVLSQKFAEEVRSAAPAWQGARSENTARI